VGADQVVVVAHHRGGADDRRLLADREMQEAAGLGLLVLPSRLLLEAANQHHLREQLSTYGGVWELRLAPGAAVAGSRRLRARLGLLSGHGSSPLQRTPTRLGTPPRTGH